jgi:hypothetical protein
MMVIVYALAGTATLVVGVMSSAVCIESPDDLSGKKMVLVIGLVAAGAGLLWMAGH